MLKIKPSTQFKRDLKKFKYNQPVIDELDKVLRILVASKDLSEKYKDHCLLGVWKKYRECHIKPDTLFIYGIDEKAGLLELKRIGSHAELFVYDTGKIF